MTAMNPEEEKMVKKQNTHTHEKNIKTGIPM